MRGFPTFRGLSSYWLEKIVQYLGNGLPAPILARKMQREWWLCRDLPERKLADQLRRLHRALSRGQFAELVQQATGNPWPEPPNLDDVNCLEVLIRLARHEEAQVNMLFEFEEQGSEIVPELTAAIKRYSDLLDRIQERRFELGLDVDHAPELRRRKRKRQPQKQ